MNNFRMAVYHLYNALNISLEVFAHCCMMRNVLMIRVGIIQLLTLVVQDESPVSIKFFGIPVQFRYVNTSSRVVVRI